MKNNLLTLFFISCTGVCFSQAASSRTATAQENSTSTTATVIDGSSRSQTVSVNANTTNSGTNGDYKDRKKTLPPKKENESSPQ